jgi:hypothetical protein
MNSLWWIFFKDAQWKVATILLAMKNFSSPTFSINPPPSAKYFVL